MASDSDIVIAISESLDVLQVGTRDEVAAHVSSHLSDPGPEAWTNIEGMQFFEVDGSELTLMCRDNDPSVWRQIGSAIDIAVLHKRVSTMLSQRVAMWEHDGGSVALPATSTWPELVAACASLYREGKGVKEPDEPPRLRPRHYKNIFHFTFVHHGHLGG